MTRLKKLLSIRYNIALNNLLRAKASYLWRER